MKGRRFENRMTANEINKEAIRALTERGYTVWRNNQHRVKGRGFKGLKGVPDIIGFTNVGCFVGCEGKADGDTFSNEQERFLSRLYVDSGQALVAFQDKEGYFNIIDYIDYLKHEQMHKKKVHKKGGADGT